MAKKGINISGTKEVLDMLKKFGESGDNAVKRTLKATSYFVSSKATQNAKYINDILFLREKVASTRGGEKLQKEVTALQNGIITIKESDLEYRIYQNNKMGAYVEFGTGAYIDIPPGWEDIAMSYYKDGKGKIAAQPYMYPAYKLGEKYLQEQMNNAIEDLTKKYGAK